MKKFVFFLLLALSINKIHANNSNLFNYDIESINLELSNLTEAESYLNTSTEEERLNIFSKFGITNHLLTPDGKREFSSIDALISVGSGVLLGCIGIAGVTLVYYLVYDDKDATKKALAYSSGGCVLFTALYIGFIYSIGGI